MRLTTSSQNSGREMERKWPDGKYIVYFQAYHATPVRDSVASSRYCTKRRSPSIADIVGINDRNAAGLSVDEWTVDRRLEGPCRQDGPSFASNSVSSRSIPHTARRIDRNHDATPQATSTTPSGV
ncbi:MAG: hypothetical protein MZU97_07015 [Bacillus subtilis]|nr:hypothetical protein [Bacillus subtilis]